MTSEARAYLAALKDLVGDEDPMAILERTPSAVASLIMGVDAKALSQRPAPGKWSISEIIAHLADAELVFGFRLRMMLTVDGAHLQAFDPDTWASTFAYESSDAHASAQLFTACRLGNLQMLRRVASSLLDNTGRHEEWGAETARGLLRLEAGHDKNHLAQIERILTLRLDGPGARHAFTPVEQKPQTPMEAAAALDLRVGTIIDVVEVPGSDRLMRLTVDFGSEKRAVIAGIREERRDPRVLIGRQALFYYNLPPKKIRGHVSEAMLRDAGYADGIMPALLSPEWPVPNGTRAG